jgi:hypothetical protein
MDAWGLSWRLALALRVPSINIDQLLIGWTIERKKAVAVATSFVVDNGQQSNETNPIKLFIWFWVLWLLQLVPSIRRKKERPQTEPLKYSYENNVAFLQNFDGGKTFPQVYCRVLYADNGQIQFTDDVIFTSRKQGLFQLIQLVEQFSEARVDTNLLTRIDNCSNGCVIGKEMTVFCKKQNGDEEIKLANVSYAVVVTGEASENSSLSISRRGTEDYNEFRFWTTFPGKRYVIVRPDRFVFAACVDEVELEYALQKIKPTLGGDIQI